MRRTRRWAASCLVAALAAVPLASGGSPAVAAGDGTRGKVAGMSVTPATRPQQLSDIDLARIRATGINTVALDVWWDVDTNSSNSMHPGAITAPDQALALTMQLAKSYGMKVTLTPKLWCPLCASTSFWRGVFKPTDPHQWFVNYRSFIVHYAQLAQQQGVSLFFVGSEYDSMQVPVFADEWRAVINAVRGVYHGQVTYESLFQSWYVVAFWRDVDVIGISAYFPLTDEPDPSLPTLLAAWHGSFDPFWRGRNWFAELAWLSAVNGRPILFGEAGYLSANGAAHMPYDGKAHGNPVNQALQARLYQAMLMTFEGQPWWMGALWWQWFEGSGGLPGDTSFTPRGKQAEQLLKSWYVQDWRPGTPGGPAAANPLPTAPSAPPGGASAVVNSVTAAAGLPVKAPVKKSTASPATRNAGATASAPSSRPVTAPLVATALLVVMAGALRALAARRGRAER